MGIGARRIVTAEDWLRNLEDRVTRIERRRLPTSGIRQIGTDFAGLDERVTALEDRPNTLDGLDDVAVTGVADGQVLTYDASAGLWVAASGGGGPSSLDDLTDVTITGPVVGQTLTFDGTEWVNQTPATVQHPRAMLRQTTAQTITNGVWSPLLFQVEDEDTHNGHDPASNPSRYTASVAGRYELSGGLTFAAFTSGQRWCRWLKNGVAVPGSGANAQANAAGQQSLVARTTTVTLAVGDYVELGAFYNGASINTYVAADYLQPSMCVRHIG